MRGSGRGRTREVPFCFLELLSGPPAFDIFVVFGFVVLRGVIPVLAEVAPLEVRIEVGRFFAKLALGRKPPMLRWCSHAEAARAVWPVIGFHALAYGGRITWRVDAGQ